MGFLKPFLALKGQIRKEITLRIFAEILQQKDPPLIVFNLVISC
jgi:hypothetical protein